MYFHVSFQSKPIFRYLPDYWLTNRYRRKISQLARWCSLNCSSAVPLHCKSANFVRVHSRIDKICPIRFPGWSAPAFWSRRRLGRDSELLVAESRKQYDIWSVIACAKRDFRSADQSCTSITVFVKCLRSWTVLCRIHRLGISSWHRSLSQYQISHSHT